MSLEIEDTVHKSCVIAYLDMADTGVRNALEDGDDLVLTPKESEELRCSLKVMQRIINRLSKQIEDVVDEYYLYTGGDE